jgi:hypothetical protein
MCLHHQGKHAEAAKLFNKTAVIMRSMPEDDFDVIHAKPNDMTLWLAYKEARTLLAAALAQPE